MIQVSMGYDPKTGRVLIKNCRPKSTFKEERTFVKPTINRIVHYVPRLETMAIRAPEHQAAIIAHINDDGTVNLGTWLWDGTPSSARNVPYDDTGKKNHSWHWPESNEEYE
jgi:hypothetical protein